MSDPTKTAADFKPDDVAPAPSVLDDQVDNKSIKYDSVFGELSEDGPNFRGVGWMGTSVLMMKSQFGLGVLSIPFVLQVLGLVPGVLAIVGIGIISLWSSYIVGEFKLRHRHVYGIDDAADMMFGKWGREVFGVVFCLFFIFCAAAAMITVSVAFNAVSTHGACTAIFIAVAGIVGFVFGSIRTLSRISWLAWVGVGSLIVAILIVTIAVSVQGAPPGAPTDVPWETDYRLFNYPTFTEALAAVSSIIFSYAGTPAYFSIVAEMRDPRKYNRSLAVCHSILIILYVVVGAVVYYYCGSYVASPAPGSAGPLIKKIVYGIALPGLFVAVLLSIHYSSKHVFVRLLRGSQHLNSNSMVHWGTWIGATFVASLLAYLIASGIPIFSGLIALIGALFGTLMTFQPMGCMWLYDHWKTGKVNRTFKWSFMVLWSVFVIVSGTFFMVAGTYSAVVDIANSYRISGNTAAWSCADNSNSA